MNYYKFKYFPGNLGCKSCLSFHNLVTLYKVLQILAIQIISINFFNLSIIYI